MARPTVIRSKPIPKPVIDGNIPDLLKHHDQWVNWRYQWKGDKWTKPPFQPDGSFASSTDSTTWSSFEVCLNAYKDLDSTFDGIGIVLGGDTGLTAIDIDKYREDSQSEWRPDAIAIVEALHSYTEISPSDIGLRIFVIADKPEGSLSKGADKHLECYDHDRYMTVTGQLYSFDEDYINIGNRQGELEQFLEDFGFYKEVKEPPELTVITPTLDDEELLNKAFSAKNGQHIKELFNGSIYGYKSPSEADLALANYLSFYSSDYAQIERLMLSSTLPNKPKWEERPVLLRWVINKALEDTHNKYQGALSVTPPTLSFLTAKELCESTPDEPDWIVEGFISVGVLTEINGKPKDGKTTICLNIVEKVISGKDFLGKPTKKTRVLYLSEERNTTLSEALRKAGLEDSEDIKILKYVDKGHATWEEVIQSARKEAIAFGAGLLFVDTLFNWTEVDEREGGTNSASTALKSMRPLQLATGDGLAVVVLRHDRKSGGGIADSAGGSTQYTGASDIVLHIGRVNGNKTIREIKTVGRLGLPDDIYIDYQDGQYFITDITAVALHQGLQAVLDLEPFTEPQTREFWEDLCGVSVGTLTSKVLPQLVKDGVLVRIGEGVRGKPYRWYKPDSIVSDIPSHLKETKDTEDVYILSSPIDKGLKETIITPTQDDHSLGINPTVSDYNDLFDSFISSTTKVNE